MTSPMIRKLNGLLKTETIGKVIHYFDETGSTNTVLSRLAEQGASEGTAVIADKQTSGKGRLGRKWFSPPGMNLYISILFRPSIPACESPLLTFLASVALVETIKKTGVRNTSIKWPNDVLIDGKKAAGVLTEMSPRGERVDYIVVGVGVNINMTRAEIKREMGETARFATSLKESLGADIDRAKFTGDFLLEIESWYQTFNRRGKTSIIREWTERWGGYNKRVRVATEDGNLIEGIATGIDGEGHLLIKKDDGSAVSIITGDVSVI
jgi:BirA family transcriptional regulator, biotin operon repressor / biotin---[acetyl-CoA-carboxylase] ligase